MTSSGKADSHEQELLNHTLAYKKDATAIPSPNSPANSPSAVNDVSVNTSTFESIRNHRFDPVHVCAEAPQFDLLTFASFNR
jgi:hypothetical protein